LARLGADIHLLCRSAERGEKALRDVAGVATGGKIELAQVDVSSLASVRAFAARWSGDRIDTLIHNAGLIPEERTLTADGLELALATHVVGPFLMSRLLESRLGSARPGRVIFVSSGGMYTQKLSPEDLDWQQRSAFDGVAAYAQTKRMQVVLAEQLAAHWSGKGIVSHSMHPGWVETDGLQKSLPNFSRWMENRLRTPAEGADTVVWLAAADPPTQCSGRFWFDRRAVRTHFVPWTRESATDRDALWSLCEERAGLRSRA